MFSREQWVGQPFTCLEYFTNNNMAGHIYGDARVNNRILTIAFRNHKPRTCVQSLIVKEHTI